MSKTDKVVKSGKVTRIAKSGMKNVGKVTSTIDVFALVREFNDVLKTRAEEKTKRVEIKAKQEIALEAIRAEKTIIQEYFQKRFDEREQIFNELFGLLEIGVGSQDSNIIDKAIDTISEVIRDNPLGDFENFRKNMNMPNYQIEL